MRRYATLATGLLGVFLTTYLLVEAFDVGLLNEPAPSLERGGAGAALLGIALLVADAFVPVASSLVMIALGALYGAPLAIALALLGRVGMAAAGFAVGRRGGPVVDRLVPPSERAHADALLERRGALAIAATRPVPLLGETVAVLAGASPLGWGRAMLAALVGSLPEVVVYSLAGAAAATFENAALIWTCFIAVVAGFWLASRWVEGRSLTTKEETR